MLRDGSAVEKGRKEGVWGSERREKGCAWVGAGSRIETHDNEGDRSDFPVLHGVV